MTANTSGSDIHYDGSPSREVSWSDRVDLFKEMQIILGNYGVRQPGDMLVAKDFSTIGTDYRVSVIGREAEGVYGTEILIARELKTDSAPARELFGDATIDDATLWREESLFVDEDGELSYREGLVLRDEDGRPVPSAAISEQLEIAVENIHSDPDVSFAALAEIQKLRTESIPVSQINAEIFNQIRTIVGNYNQNQPRSVS